MTTKPKTTSAAFDCIRCGSPKQPDDLGLAADGSGPVCTACEPVPEDDSIYRPLDAFLVNDKHGSGRPVTWYAVERPADKNLYVSSSVFTCGRPDNPTEELTSYTLWMLYDAIKQVMGDEPFRLLWCTENTPGNRSLWRAYVPKTRVES